MAKTAKQRSLQELALRKARVRKLTCSEAWVSAVVDEGQNYPPPADTTPMLPCNSPLCRGRLYPYMYISDFTCYDCQMYAKPKWFIEALPPSSSIVRM